MGREKKITQQPSGHPLGIARRLIFPIGSIVTIGRHAENSIVLSEERVSRNHARLEVSDSEVILTDLNSTNGCSIEGRQRLGSSKWREGEELQIGTYVLQLHFIAIAPVAVVRPLVEPQATPYGLKGDAPTRMERGGLPHRSTHQPAHAQAPSSGSTLRRLEIVLNAGSITQVGAPAYVIGAFEHINPTSTKVASALDEKLGRVLATVAQRGAFDSRVGEISIISMPQQQRSLTALLVFAGMGAINMFAPAVLEIVGEKLAKALSSAKILEFATVPMGVGAGLSIKDFVVRFLTGFMRGLVATKDGEAVQKLSISEVDKDRTEQIRRELKALVDEGFFAKMGFHAVLSETRVGVPGVDSAVPAAPATPVYLQVLRPSETTFEYCLLSPEHGAAIELHQHNIALGEQARIAGITERLAEFDATTGTMLASAYIPVVLQDLICRSLAKATAHLVIIHDQASSTIPWEAFYFRKSLPRAGRRRKSSLSDRQSRKHERAPDPSSGRNLAHACRRGSHGGSGWRAERRRSTYPAVPSQSRSRGYAQGQRRVAHEYSQRARLRKLRSPALCGTRRLRRIEPTTEWAHSTRRQTDGRRPARSWQGTAHDLPQRLQSQDECVVRLRAMRGQPISSGKWASLRASC